MCVRTATRTIRNRVHTSRAPVTGWPSCAHALYLSAPQAPLIGARLLQNKPTRTSHISRTQSDADRHADRPQDGALFGERKQLGVGSQQHRTRAKSITSRGATGALATSSPVAVWTFADSHTASSTDTRTIAPKHRSRTNNRTPTSLSLWEVRAASQAQGTPQQPPKKNEAGDERPHAA